MKKKLRGVEGKEGGEEEKILNLQVFVSIPIHQKVMELTPTPYQICLQKIVAMKPLRVFQIAGFSGKNLWEK